MEAWRSPGSSVASAVGFYQEPQPRGGSDEESQLPRISEGESMPGEIITMACTECKRRNYSTVKNRRNTTGRLELKKFCPFERKPTLHRETR